MATEERSIRDQLREKFRRSPRLLEMSHTEFVEDTGLDCRGAEFYKMRTEISEEKSAKPKKAKKRDKGASRQRRLQVAIAALKPLMEKEGLAEITIVRDADTGELQAEVREAPPAPIMLVVK